MLSRRHLLVKGSAATAASLLGFPAITRCASPNKVPNVAFIGVGGRGGGDLKEIT
jgi:hypothetical protein